MRYFNETKATCTTPRTSWINENIEHSYDDERVVVGVSPEPLAGALVPIHEK